MCYRASEVAPIRIFDFSFLFFDWGCRHNSIPLHDELYTRVGRSANETEGNHPREPPQSKIKNEKSKMATDQ
jgi:hypothetical protein